MAVSAKISPAEATSSLRLPMTLTWLSLPGAAAAAAAGVFVTGLYRDAAYLVPQTQGQDLITLLIAVPGTALALLGIRRGSLRAAVIWMGLLGYLLYTWIGATMAYAFNPLFPLYIALFSLSVFALVIGGNQVDVAAIGQAFGPGAPRRAVAIFLSVIGTLLTILWLVQFVPHLTAAKAPETLEPFRYVFALDLGIIVPLMFTSAALLWRQAAWGYVLAGCMLIKAAIMGLALLSMSWFAAQVGVPTPLELVASYSLIAGGGITMSVWFLRHCRG